MLNLTINRVFTLFLPARYVLGRRIDSSMSIRQHPKTYVSIDEHRDELLERHMNGALKPMSRIVWEVLIMSFGQRILSRGFRKISRASTKMLEFDGYRVEVSPSHRSVRVAILSVDFDIAHVIVKMVDAAGLCLAQTSTNKQGVAVLALPVQEEGYELAFEWPK